MAPHKIKIIICRTTHIIKINFDNNIYVAQNNTAVIIISTITPHGPSLLFIIIVIIITVLYLLLWVGYHVRHNS